MAENKCSGDCLKCSFQQQVYCAAQRSYAMMENQRAIVERLDRISEAIGSITASNNIIPLTKDSEAQNSGGAENRPEQTI